MLALEATLLSPSLFPCHRTSCRCHSFPIRSIPSPHLLPGYAPHPCPLHAQHSIGAQWWPSSPVTGLLHKGRQLRPLQSSSRSGTDHHQELDLSHPARTGTSRVTIWGGAPTGLETVTIFQIMPGGSSSELGFQNRLKSYTAKHWAHCWGASSFSFFFSYSNILIFFKE